MSAVKNFEKAYQVLKIEGGIYLIIRHSFGAALFVLLMFFNLQIATNPNSNGDIDLFGLKISLFMPSVYATASCKAELKCGTSGTVSCSGDRECRILGSCVYCDSVSACC
ncbi:hypothetical protein ABRY23_06030 [Melioribacteraceae bacterium 4301-Me]|uniref:hypothetical protein n=1 Tax=Pyranulibacter aquaticus TaxID=3163344 RepID=UPI003596A8D1